MKTQLLLTNNTMNIKELTLKPSKTNNSKLSTQITSFQNLLTQLRGRSLPTSEIEFINQQIDVINSFNGAEKDLMKTIKSSVKSILKQVEKSVKIVTKGYYRNLYMAIGIGAFGVPFGVAFSAALDNYAFIGVGMPIGMSIGIAIGAQMDEKAKKEGRQLDVEMSL
ncbi:MAG: hypothetical protein CMP48_13805 [Rickettsiales bacterium]|nr:hypothetical protein [Rickettsiales bacterium]